MINPKTSYCFFLLLFFTLISQKVSATTNQRSTIVLQDGGNHLEITQHLDYFVDTSSSKTIGEISSASFQNNFQPVTDLHIVYEHLEDYIWLRMVVQNQQSTHKHSWYFESWGFDIDEITFFYPNPDGSFSPTTAGYDLPFGQRNIQHKNFNFLLDIRPGETKNYYFKIKRSYPLEFNFRLRTNDKFMAHSLNEYLLLGIYYGVLILILVFNIYLFFKLKDTLYLYFPLVILSCIWFSLGRDGLGFQYLWPNYPQVNQLINENFVELMIIISTLLFSNRFVQKYTKSNKVLKFTFWAILIKMVLFIYQIFGSPLTANTYIIATILILLVPFTLGLRSLIKVKIYSWSYTFAYACLFLVIAYSYSKTITLFDDPVINWYFVHPVIFVEVVLFSLSVFNQIKFLQDQYLVANREKTLALEENNRLTQELNTKLKQKVRERTEKIERMAQDLANKNVALQTTNIKLQELNSQVNQINDYLRENNEQLRTSVDEITKNLALMKGLDFEDFKKVFPDKESCLQFLSELKWKDKFLCKKCGYNKYTDGPNHGRRCKNCNYYESPTVETLFHKLKFPIEKAFYILYLSNRKDVDLTLNELSEILDLRRETCWAFKNKITQAMEKVGHNKELSGWESLALVHLE